MDFVKYFASQISAFQNGFHYLGFAKYFSGSRIFAELKGDLPRKNTLNSSERAFKMFENDMFCHFHQSSRSRVMKL